MTLRFEETDFEDERRSVRITPAEEIEIFCAEHKFDVINISSQGIAFRSDKYKLGDSIEASVQLPFSDPDETNSFPLISFTLFIVMIKDDVCHCRIDKIDGFTRALLDKYILNEQKIQIRKLKKHQESD